MKKVLSVFAACCLLLTAVVPVWAQPPISVVVDGAKLSFDVDPIIESDRTLVPMRGIFEALGAKVDWDAGTRTAKALKGNTSVWVTIDSNVMLKNGEDVALDAPARLIDDRTLVPVRAVSEGLGAEVDWDADTRTVTITTKKEETKPPEEEPALPPEEEPEQPEDEPEQPAENEDGQTAGEEDGLPFTALSEADMETLKGFYNNRIRYDFEQVSLARVALGDPDFAKKITSKTADVVDLVYQTWNKVVMGNIIAIQMDSETFYDVTTEVESEDALYEAYLPLVKEAGLEAGDYFDVSFETLENGYPVLLVTFRETDAYVACKFIGVVALPNGAVRYFTAETDLVDPEHLYFCEVTAERRGTIGQTGFGKEEFLNCAQITIAENLQMAGAMERPLF